MNLLIAKPTKFFSKSWNIFFNGARVAKINVPWSRYFIDFGWAQFEQKQEKVLDLTFPIRVDDVLGAREVKTKLLDGETTVAEVHQKRLGSNEQMELQWGDRKLDITLENSGFGVWKITEDNRPIAQINMKGLRQRNIEIDDSSVPLRILALAFWSTLYKL